jgi:hypothetical protein
VFLKNGRCHLDYGVYVGGLSDYGGGNVGWEERTCDWLTLGGERPDCGDLCCVVMDELAGVESE